MCEGVVEGRAATGLSTGHRTTSAVLINPLSAFCLPVLCYAVPVLCLCCAVLCCAVLCLCLVQGTPEENVEHFFKVAKEIRYADL